MNNTLNQAVIRAAVFLTAVVIGNLNAWGQAENPQVQLADPVVITVSVPLDCDGSVVITNTIIDLESLIEPILEAAYGTVELVSFYDVTQTNFSGGVVVNAGNGPTGLNVITYREEVVPRRLEFYIDDFCCFSGDTVGYLVEAEFTDPNAPRYFFGIIEYRAVLDPPVANNDRYEVDKLGVLSVPADGVLSNDLVNPCCDVELEVVVEPLHGTVELFNDGSFVYTHTNNACTDDFFYYEIVSCGLTSNVARVDIEVNQFNRFPPVCQSHFFEVDMNNQETAANGITNSVSGNVMDGAFDPDDGPDCPETILIPVLVSPPANGQLDLVEVDSVWTGEFTYTPEPNTCGEDTFTYYVTDGEFDSTICTVTIDVIETNQCPFIDTDLSTEHVTYRITLSELRDKAEAGASESWLIPATSMGLYSRVIDHDAGSDCGLTDLFWAVNIDSLNYPAINASVGPANGLLLSWDWAMLLPQIIDDFPCEPCDSVLRDIIDVEIFQDDCPVLIETMLFELFKDDLPPVAEPVMWPPSYNDWLLLDWLTTRYPDVPWTDECLVLEDSVDNLIPLPALLIPAYQNNPDNCCEEWSVEMVGCCPQVVCTDGQFTERLIVDFWPEPEDDYEMTINGETFVFATLRGDEVSTARGGTATLDGSYIRYTPPANWPLCEFDYDYIPYKIRQTTEHDCETTDQPTAISYIQVRVCGVCDEPVAQDDHVVVCADQDNEITMASLLANDFDVDFPQQDVVMFLGGMGSQLLGNEAAPEKVGPSPEGNFTLVPFGANWQAAFPDFETSAVIEGDDSCSQGTILLSEELRKRVVPPWDLYPGYTGPVWEGDVNTLTLTLPPNTSAFALHLLTSVLTDEVEVTATSNTGASETVMVGPIDSAQGVAFYVGMPGEELVSIEIVNASQTGLTIGDLRISQQPVAFVCGVGLEVAPQHGELIINEVVTDIGAIPVSLVYRPQPGYAGPDSFSYEICIIKTCGDGEEDIYSATGVVHLYVLPDGQPIAVDDDLYYEGYILTQGAGEVLDISAEVLLANDYPSAWLDIVAFDDSMTEGSVTWDPVTQLFTYDPGPDFAGCDTFWYQVQLKEGVISACSDITTDWAEVTVYVQPRPPVGGNLIVPNIEILPGVTYTINVFDLIEQEYGIVHDPDFITVKVRPFSGGAVQDGRMVQIENGVFVYTPDPDIVNTLDGFVYYLEDAGQISDGECHFSWVPQISPDYQVSLYVEYTPLPPVPDAITLVTRRNSEGVQGNFSATDPQALLGFGGITGYDVVTQPANGTVIHSGGSVFTYIPNDCYYNYRAGAFVQPVETFQYRAHNAAGLSAVGTVSVRVNWLAVPPIAVEDVATTPRNTAVIINVLENDIDVCMDGKDDWRVVHLNDSANGTLTVMLGGQQIRYRPHTNFYGDDSFTYEVRNSAGQTARASVYVDVTFANIAPRVPVVTVPEPLLKDDVKAGVLPTTFTDEGQALVFEIVNQPANGTVSLNALTGAYEYTPDPLYYNVRGGQIIGSLDIFTYRAGHAGGNWSEEGEVRMQVLWRNYPPVATVPAAPVPVDEAGSITIDVTDWVSDVDSPDSQWLVSITEDSAHRGNLLVNGLLITYTAPDCYVGPDAFTYRVADGDGGTVEATVPLNVVRAVDPKAYDLTIETTRGKLVDGQVTGDNCDPDDDVEFELVSDPSHASAFIFREDGTFTYTPEDGYFNVRPDHPEMDPDTFTFKAKDSFGESEEATVSIRVVWESRAPVADPQLVQTVQSADVEITLTGTHVDDSPLTFEILGGPESGSLLGLSGLPKVTYRPDRGFSGEDTFTFRVQAGDKWSEPATVTVEVIPGWYVEGDVEGDGVANPAVYVLDNPPNTGRWSAILANGQETFTRWGGLGLIPVPGDYTGDGVMNPAVFDPKTAEWMIQLDEDGGEYNVAFGWRSVIPVPADYDGDGVTDIAVYHPQTGTWYIDQSSDGLLVLGWGWSTALPVPADYTGNGRADIAVYHPPSGMWYIRDENSNAIAISLGSSAMKPVPADYDGNGKANVAVYRAADGMWYIADENGDLLLSTAFGWSTAIPVPADYDGDGRANLAVHHRASGMWYVDTPGGVISYELGDSKSMPVTSSPGIWYLTR